MILVTGADGIVGRAVCSVLKLARLEFVPLVRQRQSVTAENAIVSDLSDASVLGILSRYDITSIVHLAAAVPHSVDYPDTEVSAELTKRMDRNIFALQQQLRIPVVYMSTCGLYDRSLPTVKFEDDRSVIKIESPYFAAKFEGEKLFSAATCPTILRLSAPVGPGLKPSLVLSRFILAAQSSSSIEIWGSGDREQNFIDVRDVADLILRVIKNPKTCTLNVAGSNPITMSELANVVVDLVGRGSIEYSSKADPREGETARYSIQNAAMLYGWSPKNSIHESCKLVLNEAL